MLKGLAITPPVLGRISIGKVVEKCAETAGWKRTGRGWTRPGKTVLGEPAAPHLRRGLGFACAFKNVGFSFGAPENSWSTVELHGGGEIQRVVVHHAGAEVGQARRP